MEEKKVKKVGGGFGLRLAFAIIFTVFALVMLVTFLVSGIIPKGDDKVIIVSSVTAFLAFYAIIGYIGAFVGKKHKWANVMLIAFSVILCLAGVGVIIALPGLIGGSAGIKALAGEQPVAEEKEIESEAQTAEPEEQTVTSSFAAEGEYEEQKIKRSEFKLDLYDANVDEKTWKEFKKTASQEELCVIALGAKYRIAHGRIMNLLFALGIVLSIALLWPTGFYSLIGYPVFAFLATKSIRYEDTYGQSYKKLDKEYRAFIDNYFNSNIGLTILDTIIKIVIFWLTIPYQAILLFIGMFAPNFVISKNGILVSIPKGFDVGNLGAVGAYYSSFSFIDEALDNRRAEKASGEVYRDKYGDTKILEEQVYVKEDRYEKVYKDENGNEYVSDDNGKHASR